MHPRFALYLAALLAPLLASTAGWAETRKLALPGATLSWDSAQLPDAVWQVSGQIAVPQLEHSGANWVYLGGGPLVISFTTLADTTDLAQTFFHLDIGQPQLLPLPGGEALQTVLDPAGIHARSESLLIAPAYSQLVTSSGRSKLFLGVENNSAVAFSPYLIATPEGLLNRLDRPALPSGSIDPLDLQDGLDFRLTANVYGSYHLVASTDPNCMSVDCMVGQRASATLRRVDVIIPAAFQVVAISSVPEPHAWALLPLGALVLALRMRRTRET
jgi:hypothetical protein